MTVLSLIEHPELKAVSFLGKRKKINSLIWINKFYFYKWPPTHFYREEQFDNSIRIRCCNNNIIRIVYLLYILENGLALCIHWF